MATGLDLRLLTAGVPGETRAGARGGGAEVPLFTAPGVTLHGFFAFRGRTRDFQVLPDTAGSCGDPEPGLTVQGSERGLQPAGPRTPGWCWSLLSCSLQRPSRGLGSLPQAFAGATRCFQRSVLLLTLSGNAVSGALPGMRLAREEEFAQVYSQ